MNYRLTAALLLLVVTPTLHAKTTIIHAGKVYKD